jgi:hypothetical protein
MRPVTASGQKTRFCFCASFANETLFYKSTDPPLPKAGADKTEALTSPGIAARLRGRDAS